MDVKNLEQEIGLLHERICSALGDPSRLLILYLLSEKDLFVNEIADAMDMPNQAFHATCGCCGNAAWWIRKDRGRRCCIG